MTNKIKQSGRKLELTIKFIIYFGLAGYVLLAVKSFGNSNSIVGPNGYYILGRIGFEGFLTATIYILQSVLIGLLLAFLTSNTINPSSKQIISYLTSAMFYVYPVTTLISAFKQLPNKGICKNILNCWQVWLPQICPLVWFAIIIICSVLFIPRNFSDNN